MNGTNQELHESLDPGLRDLLSRLRQRVRRYIVWDSALAIAAVVLAMFWLALAIDYLPVRIGGTEMPRSARAVGLVLLLGVVGWIAWRWLLGRLHRDLPDDSLALLIERHHPELGGRLVTAVQLTRSRRADDAWSPALLKRVHRDASWAARQADLNRVFRWQPIRRKALVVVPMLVAVFALGLFRSEVLGQAIARLSLFSDRPWPRRAALEMIGVEVPVISASESDSGKTELLTFDTNGYDGGRLRLPRGSSTTLRVRAAGDELGHIVPEVCVATYVTASGQRGQSNLRRVGRIVDGYQAFVLDGPPLASLAESVELTIRGLDDRLANYQIEAVTPPMIASMNLAIRYPKYLRIVDTDSFDREIDYQAGARVREGSELVLRGRSDRPLGQLDVAIDDGRETGSPAMDPPDANPSSPIAPDSTTPKSSRPEPILSEPILPEPILSDDGLGFELRLTDVRRPMSVRMVPSDFDGISAQAAYRYYIGVVNDQPPETSMRLRGIGSAVTPIALLPIQATATDDYGIESVQIAMAVTQPVAEGASDVPNDPDAADELQFTPELDRDGATKLTIDLRELAQTNRQKELEPGATIGLFLTAQDGYDLGDSHLVRGETIRLQVVSPEDLLAKLEGRELEFRSRLEQAIDETRRLRQGLAALRADGVELGNSDLGIADGGDGDPNGGKSGDRNPDDVDEFDSPDDADPLTDGESARARQRLRLRIRQAELQVAKTTEELTGIVAGLDDLLLEMINNRVDSVDRRERIRDGVRDPLNGVTTEPLPQLRRQITDLERIWMDADSTLPAFELGADGALATTDQVLLSLQAVLEKMLDLESFNEILDLVRGLIDDQEEILDETAKEREKAVLDLFQSES